MNVVDRITNKFWRSIFLPKAKIVINSKRYVIPRLLKNNFYLDTYRSEVWLLELLQKIHSIRPIKVFFDVGVNIGQTLLKIRAVNNDVIYYGIEPNPFCCSITKQVITENRFLNCNIIPCGLSDKEELVKLSLSQKNDITDSSATVIPNFRSKGFADYQYVTLFKFDTLLSTLNVNKIDLIKIDIEGSELEAIRGMLCALNKYLPIIIIEVLPSYDSTNHFRISRQNELYNLLENLDYVFFQISYIEDELVLRGVKSFPIHSNLSESDYFLVPKHINVMELDIQIIH